MRTLRIRRAAGVLVAMWGVMALALPALAGPDGSAQVNLAQAVKKTALVFPFDVPDTVGNKAEISSLLTDMARSRLSASGTYIVIEFHKSLPPVARLHNDQVLSDSDVSEPFAESNTKAIKVTKAVGYDVAFVGSVDTYDYSAADKQVNVTISGRLIDVNSGKILKSATLTGASSTGGNAKEDARAVEAARSAGEKLMTQLVPIVSATEVAPTQPTKPAKSSHQRGSGAKRHSNDWLWGVLAVAVGVGIGLASGGGGGGGGNGGNGGGPPAPP